MLNFKIFLLILSVYSISKTPSTSPKYACFLPSISVETVTHPSINLFLGSLLGKIISKSIFPEKSLVNSYTTQGRLRIFANRSNSQYPIGSVAEIIVIDDFSQRENFEGYLAHKWAISEKLDSDHIYKTERPSIENDPSYHQFDLKVLNQCNQLDGTFLYDSAVNFEIHSPVVSIEEN